MSEEQDKKETVQETIKRLHEICRKLQEENERLKEKVRTFYGH